MPISTSLSCFSGILSYSSIWVIILFLLIMNKFLWMWFFFWGYGILTSSIYLLVDEAKRLMQASWWEGLAMRKTRSCSSGLGWAVLSKTLILEGSHQGVPPGLQPQVPPSLWWSTAIPFSRASFQPRDWTWVVFFVGGFFTIWATREAWWGY